MIDLATWTPSTNDRRAALISAVALVIAAVALTPFAQMRLGAIPAFMPSVFAAAILAQAITAFLLYSQYRTTRNLGLGLLAAAYLFAALTLIPYVLSYPGIFGSPQIAGAGRETSAWIWVCWHYGFLALLILYCAAVGGAKGREIDAQRNRRLISSFLVFDIAFCVVMVAITYHFGDRLPAMFGATRWTPLFSAVLAPVALALGFLALFAVVRLTKLRTVVDVWLAVVIVGTILDVYLTLIGEARYSLGWYTARLELFAASISILCIFMYHIDKVYNVVALSNRELFSQALLDGLTEVSNRRSFDKHIATAVSHCARSRHPLAVLMIDIDHFKKYNDTFGHQAGDECLREIAQAIRAQVRRPLDFVARYGGEEFAVVLTDTHRRGALVVADRMRAAVEALHLNHAPGAKYPWVTISVGACSMVPSFDTGPALLIHRADEALYEAKAGGRNRVRLSETEDTAPA